MTLVEIRHGRCRALLYEVNGAPADWAGTLQVPPCPRCDGGTRGGRFIRWARPKARRGDPLTATVAYRLAWQQLRPAVERAQATGRVQIETVG